MTLFFGGLRFEVDLSHRPNLFDAVTVVRIRYIIINVDTIDVCIYVSMYIYIVRCG